MYTAQAQTRQGIANTSENPKTSGNGNGKPEARRSKPAAWGRVPVALSVLVMLARRFHRLQTHHYTS